MTIDDWLMFYMMEQFKEYIHSADYITIPWINVKIPALYRTQNGKEKIGIAKDISSELSEILQNTNPANKKSEQTWVDLTVLRHKETLEKLRIDSTSVVTMGKLEKLIQSYFHLLKDESPKMQAYSASFLAEADFQMISFDKQDCRKHLITFCIKQYFMCCVELEKKSIVSACQDLKSITEDAHFQELKKLILEALKVSDKFQDNKLDLIRIIDALSIKVTSDAILSKKTNKDPLLKNFLNEIEILKAMIAKFMREEFEQEKTVAALHVVSASSAAVVMQPPVSAVATMQSVATAHPIASASAAASPQPVLLSAKSNLKQSKDMPVKSTLVQAAVVDTAVVDKKAAEETGLQISQSVQSVQLGSASGSLMGGHYVTPLMMSQAIIQSTGSQPTDVLCHSIISTDSLDSDLNASIAELVATCVSSGILLTNKS